MHSVAKFNVLTEIWLNSALLIFRAYQFWIFKIQIPHFSIKKRRYYVVFIIKKTTLCTQGFFQKSLGRVLDEANGIYQSRERGVFTYDLQTDTYGVPDSALIPVVRRDKAEKLILDFGDAWFLDSYIRKKKWYKVIDAIDYGNNDSVRALIQYYVLCNMANCHAETWYEGSYARILYPKANLASQRISDMLASLGDEWTYREFFKAYLSVAAQIG